MKRPDEKIVRVLVGIKKSTYGDDFIRWLKESYILSLQESVNPDDVKCRQKQGASQELLEMTSHFENSEKYLEAFLKSGNIGEVL